MNRRNYHTHTFRCKHAYGYDEDYVKEAIKNEYSTLGFADHTPWVYDSKFVSTIRMDVSQFDDYQSSIRLLQDKYKDQIEILCGLEAEYFPKYQEWLLQFCIEKDVDYLILGNHYYKSDEYGIYFGYCPSSYLTRYFETCIEGLRTGMYSYLAHPELIMLSHDWNDEIAQGFERVCQEAKAMDIPLECNVTGLGSNPPSYPHPKFWEIASKYHNKAIIGMDAHAPSRVNAELYDRAHRMLENYDVEIVDEIPRVDFRSISIYK